MFSTGSLGPVGDEDQFSKGLCLTRTLPFQRSPGLSLPAELRWGSAGLQLSHSHAHAWPLDPLGPDLQMDFQLGLGPTSS